MTFNNQKNRIITFSLHLLSSTILLTNIPLIAMDQSLPKLLVIDDKFPVYTRDFINEEIRAIIESKKFSVSIFSEEIITDHNQLEKLPDWMKHNPVEQLTTIPNNLNEFALVFACWGHIGEKIAQLKHEGSYDGVLVTRFRGAPEEHIGNPDTSHYPYLKQYGDLYLPNCDFFRKELCDKFNFDAKKFIVHYESVDVDIIQQIITEIKPSTSINNSISILSVCRLEPKKGINLALEAIAHLCKKNTMPHISYTIIGEGSQRTQLEELIKKLQLDDIVTLVGGKNKKEVIKMMTQSKILLAPSCTSKDGDVEGIMNIFKEAALAGTIAVATDHAGAPELIKHDITGVLARQNDVNDLIEKLTYAISNVHRWPEWRKNLQKEVQQNFNGTYTHPQLIEFLINTLVAKNNH